jgi:phosphatidylserine/phosphatidylglycerophosphate/cardiolipin synthase-like enzyme
LKVTELPTRSGSIRRRWLPHPRPRPGRRLPAELRSESVCRIAESLAGGVQDPELLALIQRIDQGPVHMGGAVRVYFNREQAFGAILEAIAGARREVLIESYVLNDDGPGRASRGPWSEPRLVG